MRTIKKTSAKKYQAGVAKPKLTSKAKPKAAYGMAVNSSKRTEGTNKYKGTYGTAVTDSMMKKGGTTKKKMKTGVSTKKKK